MLRLLLTHMWLHQGHELMVQKDCSNPGRVSAVCVCAQSLSQVQLFATLQTVALQAPLCMGFLWQEYWSRLPFSPPKNFPESGIEPTSPALHAGSLPLSHCGSPLSYNIRLSFLEVIMSVTYFPDSRSALFSGPCCCCCCC